MAAPKLSDADFERQARFRHALRRFLRFSEDASRRAGIAPGQYPLLLFVRATAGRSPTIADLAERLQVTHHSAVELVDRCEKAGLVRRHQDPRDARRVRVRLTATGSRLLERLVREHRTRAGELRVALPGPPLAGGRRTGSSAPPRSSGGRRPAP